VFAYDMDGGGHASLECRHRGMDPWRLHIPTSNGGPPARPSSGNLVILQVRHPGRLVPPGPERGDGRDGVEDRTRRAAVVGTPTPWPRHPPVRCCDECVRSSSAARPSQEGLWRLGGSSKITAPTPIVSDDLLVVASGRGLSGPSSSCGPAASGRPDAPRREHDQRRGGVEPHGARALHADAARASTACSTCWANNGVFDAYRLRTRVRNSTGSACRSSAAEYSASPGCADGKNHLSGEDGDVLVIAAGRSSKHLATNPLGEPLMATRAVGRRDVRPLSIDALCDRGGGK